MKFLVISGAPGTGKTTAINKIAEWLTKGVITTNINGNPLPTFLPDPTGKYQDFSIIIIMGGKKIIIHSATDNQKRMKELYNKIEYHTDTEIVITTCRDIHSEKEYFIKYLKPFATFFLESPLGKGTRKNNFNLADTWYKNSLLALHQHILKNNPYDI